MILHNITFFIAPDIEQQFRDFALGTLLPAVSAAESLTDPLISRILAGEEATLAPGYALQMKAESETVLHEALTVYVEPLIRQMAQQHGENFLTFSTSMEIL